MSEIIISKEKLIMLKGNLTSANASEIQEDLEWELDHTRELTIDLTDLNKLDVVGVFMLLILKKKAITAGKKIMIINHDNKVVNKSILNSGMQNIIDVV